MALNQESTGLSNKESNSAESELGFFGPSLPPYFFMKDSTTESESEKMYGPTLPPLNISKQEESSGITLLDSYGKGKILIGPEIPEYLKSTTTAPEGKKEDTHEVSDDNFGPSTTLMATGDAAGYYRFLSAQSQNIKCDSEPSIERETWMTELPQKQRTNFGLLPRHFKSRIQTEKESDSSVWTDTPGDKKKAKDNKKDHKEILKKKRLQERDKEMEKLAEKAWRKLRKKESLLEIHLKNMKRKKKNETEKREEALPERRPFDRNVDLQIRKVDENRKRAILNKSQFLNDRFAPGASKFL